MQKVKYSLNFLIYLFSDKINPTLFESNHLPTVYPENSSQTTRNKRTSKCIFNVSSRISGRSALAEKACNSIELAHRFSIGGGLIQYLLEATRPALRYTYTQLTAWAGWAKLQLPRTKAPEMLIYLLITQSTGNSFEYVCEAADV